MDEHNAQERQRNEVNRSHKKREAQMELEIQVETFPYDILHNHQRQDYDMADNEIHRSRVGRTETPQEPYRCATSGAPLCYPYQDRHDEKLRSALYTQIELGGSFFKYFANQFHPVDVSHTHELAHDDESVKTMSPSMIQGAVISSPTKPNLSPRGMISINNTAESKSPIIKLAMDGHSDVKKMHSLFGKSLPHSKRSGQGLQ